MENVRKLYSAKLPSELEMSTPENTVTAALIEIGLSNNEINLYKTALNLGPRPASILARTIRVQRTRVYDLLSSLEARGLIETVERNKVRYYTATSPERLITLLRDRKEHVSDQLTRLEQVVPILYAKNNKTETLVTSRTIRGTQVVKDLLLELLDEDISTILTIGDIEHALRTTVGLSRWASTFREKRIEKKIHLRMAIEGTPDFIEEKDLIRDTLSSPSIPGGILAMATDKTVVVLRLKDTAQATHFRSELFCSVLHGMYCSWLGAVQRMS